MLAQRDTAERYKAHWLAERFLAEVDRSQEVDVARGTCSRAEPIAQKQRALEGEIVAVR